MAYRCPMSITGGAREAIRCKTSGSVCAHQKMCMMEGRIVLTAGAMDCPGRDEAGRAAAQPVDDPGQAAAADSAAVPAKKPGRKPAEKKTTAKAGAKRGTGK